MKLLNIGELEKYLKNELNKIPKKENVKFDIQFNKPFYDCQQYIEISNNKYHLLCYERGELVQDDSTSDLGDFSYWVFRILTHDAALNYARKHDLHYQDRRRLWFPKWLELMGYINNKYMERCKAEIDKTLEQHPYNDSINIKLDLIVDMEKLFISLESLDPPETLKNKVVSSLERINHLHKFGSNDIDQFLLGLCSEAAAISDSINDYEYDFIRSGLNTAIEKARHTILSNKPM